MVLTARIFWLFVILLVPVFILGADYVLYRFGGNDLTLSRFFLQVESRWIMYAVMVAFDIGVVVGHMAVPQTPAGGGN